MSFLSLSQFVIENSARKYVLGSEIYIEEKCFQIMSYCENFQPDMEGQQALGWDQFFFSKSEFIPHSSFTSLLGSHDVFCRFLMKPFQAFWKAGVHENERGHLLEYVCQSYEMQGLHYEDLVWNKNEPFLSYCNPIKRWVDEACRCTCQTWDDLGDIAHPHELDFVSCYDAMYVPTHDHVVYDISLFWSYYRTQRKELQL